MNFGEDFGQKVDLTASIRNILRNYPEGTAILKELIQNADDAGARNISFCLDLRNHGTKLIASASLEQFQGPSLLVYNDAMFTNEDFKSIQRIGDSLKKTSETKTKIGRFGIGFNAIYHLTDLPSFVSSTSLVMFDPQAKFLPNVNPSNPGKIIDYLADPELLLTLADQFKPYESYGLDWRKPFDGTIFRLPLRTEAQARESLLSNRASDRSIHHLLQALQEEAASMLLFLKSIESIEIKKWSTNDSLPISTFHCNISNANEELRNLRSCAKFVKNHDANIPIYTQIFSMDYSLIIKINNFYDSVNEELWEVCNQLGGTEANEIANDSANSALRLVPWGGVAACITPGEGGSQKVYDISSESKGLAYCFLPLPVRTGLPVMLNGFFELSSNRRDIWQASTDMTGDGETRAMWNIALLNSVVAPSYCRLLSRLKEKLEFSELYQRHWPSTKSAVTSPWKEFCKVVLDNSRNEALLLKSYTNETSSNQVTVIKNRSSKSMHWLTPLESVVVPACGLWYQSEDEEYWLVDILRSLNLPLVRCSSYLRDSLEIANICTNIAVPSLIRRALREYTKELYSNSSYGPTFLTGTACCRFLLHYCMLDLHMNTINTELDNLLILPLLSGEMGIMRVFTAEQSNLLATLVSMDFTPSLALQALLRSNFQTNVALEYLTNPNERNEQSTLTSTSLFVLCGHDEMQVFSGGASQMILNRDVIGVQEMEFLSHDVMQKCSNIRLFSANLVSDLLCKILPNYFMNGTSVSYENLIIAEDWDRIVNFLNVFWNYVAAHPEVISAVAEGFPLLPTTKKIVMPLSRVSNLIMIRQTINPTATITATDSEDNSRLDMSVNVSKVLCDLGATMIDLTVLSSLVTKTTELPPAFWSYVYDTSRSKVLSLLDSLVRGAGKAGHDCFLNTTHVQRDMILNFIVTSEPLNFLTNEEKIIIRQKLPLFSSFNGSNYFILDSLSKGPHGHTGKQNNTKKIPTTLNDTRFLHSTLFPENFVYHNAKVPQQLQLLSLLQVNILSRSSYLKDVFLPNIQSLYENFPEDTEKDIFQMLSELSNLAVEDPLFVNDISKFSFVPCGRMRSSSRISSNDNNNNSQVNGKKLFLPSELFDPSIDELSSLLEPSFFPCELLQRNDILVYLRAAGLRTALDWPSIIECARVISSNMSSINYSEISNVDFSPQNQQEQDRCCQQGVSLLHYLDNHTERLFSSKSSQSSQKSKTDKNSRDTSTATTGLSLFGFSSFFNQNITNSVSGSSSSSNQSEVVVSISSYLEELQLLEWMPILTTPLHPLMPWPNTTSTTSTKPMTCPSVCRTSSDAWYCSASLCVAAVTISSESLRSALGWNQPIPFYVIAIQLRELGKKFMDAQKSSQLQQRQRQQLNSLGNEIESSPSTSSEILSTVLPQLYQRLHAVVSNADELEVVSNILAGYPCIWVGDRFVRPDQSAFVCAINISPYLYQVPVDMMAAHRSLFSVLGVKDSFGINDYLQVLRQLANETGAMREDSKSALTSEPSSPLSQSQLSLVLSLVSLLDSDNYGGGGILSLKDREVYLPDNSCRLGLSTSLVLDDVPWMAGPVCAVVRTTERMLHASVAAKIAHKVGVRSLRNVLISRSTDSSSIFDESSVSVGSTGTAKSGGVSAEAFGQAESLTNRLKTILDMYPDGSPIFSELIQNADDAGATVVRILLDENSYGTESLLAPTMSPLQGPALLIYNDALFSESDFRSLARIGQGSKMEKLATTGRFGLGFNSVYHLTDVPSFVSGDSLVYFDPHTAFVPGATASQPGLRIKLSQSHGTLGMEFPNQCQVELRIPFNFFGCDFAGIFPGTLFRFPLRSEILARKSEVSRTAYQVADIVSLIDQLRTLLPVLPLFLRSVTNIEIYRCSQGKSTPQLLYSVSKSTKRIHRESEGAGSADISLLTFFEKTLDDKSSSSATATTPPAPVTRKGGGGGGGGGITQLNNRDDFYALLSRTPDADLPYHIDDLTITLKESSVENVIRTECWVYLLVSGICGGRAKKMACHLNTRHLKLVPMGAVAACVEHWESDPSSLDTTINDNFDNPDDTINATELSTNNITQLPHTVLSTDIIGRAFCFLPLPVLTQLPVHVNAYFELNSSRRDIWRGQDTTGEARAKSEWNELLMREVLSSLYAKLLTSRTNQLKNCPVNKEDKESKLTAILRLLPCPPPPSPWNHVSLALFTLLKELEVIWTESNGGGFVTAGKSYFLNEEEVLSVDSINRKMTVDGTVVSTDSNIGDQIKYLHSLLLTEGIPVVRTSSIICSTLMSAGCAGGLVSPAFVRSHFRTADLSMSLLTSRVHPSLLTSTVHGIESGVQSYNLDAAVFLLRYCLRDIPPVSVTALIGLPLLPLEDNSLGRIGDSTDPPLFLVSEAERKLLLGRAGGSIVASETYLGHSFSSMLQNSTFLDCSNVHQLVPLDMLKMLSRIVPSEWLTSTVLVVTRHEKIIEEFGLDDLWLRNLWTYLSDMNVVSLFGSMLPIVPIGGIGSVPSGLAKVSPSIPILHMTTASRDMNSLAIETLSLLGIHIFNPAVLGGQSYSTSVTALLSDTTPYGHLQSILSSPNIKDTASSSSLMRQSEGNDTPSSWSTMPIWFTMSTNHRDALRSFILDDLLSKLGNIELNKEQSRLLRSLPVWQCCSNNEIQIDRVNRESDMEFGKSTTTTTTVAEAAAIRSTLGESSMDEAKDNSSSLVLIPPRGIGEKWLCSNFVKLRDDNDRSLYRMLGLEELSPGHFIIRFLIPRILKGELTDQVDDIAIFILKNLLAFELDCPGLIDFLSSKSFIRNTVGVCCPPNTLFDPTAAHLSALLPPESFPASSLCPSTDPSHLHSLRQLGLGNTLTCSAVLRVALSLHQQSKSKMTVDEALRTVHINRGDGLLKHLDLHIAQLLEEASQGSAIESLRTILQEANTEFDLTDFDHSGSLAVMELEPREGDLSMLKLFCGAIRLLSWLPVLTGPPPSTSLVQILPWPTTLHMSSYLAAPQDCRSMADAWYCSSTMRIACTDPISATCKVCFSWQTPLTGHTVSHQLLALSQSYTSSSSSSTSSSSSNSMISALSLQLHKSFPVIMQMLSEAYQKDPIQAEQWLAVIIDKPILWIGGRFIETSKVAFQSLNGVDAEPYLFVARSDLIEFKPLLLSLGAKEFFGPADLVSMLAELAKTHSNTPLTESLLDVALGILKILCRLYELDTKLVEVNQGEGIVEEKHGIDDDDVASQDGLECTSSVSSDSCDSSSISKRQQQERQMALVELKTLWPIFVPDTNRILMPSTSLTINDAPWFTPTFNALQKRNRDIDLGIRLTHSRVEPSIGRLVGVRSLREQLFAGDDIICPYPKNLQNLIGDDSLSESLGSLLGLADDLGARSVQVIYDKRQHRNESLMHPGLSAAQGPSITLYLEGVRLGTEGILQALATPSMLRSSSSSSSSSPIPANDNYMSSPKKIKGVMLDGISSAMHSSSSSSSGGGDGNSSYVSASKRLSSCFAVTDCLQIISGSSFYIFDPCGSHLLGIEGMSNGLDDGANSTATGTTVGKATTMKSNHLQSQLPGDVPLSLSSSSSIPRGQRCAIIGENSKDVLSRFPDQFEPLLSLPFSGGIGKILLSKGELPGLLLRLPLRAQPSVVSKCILQEVDIIHAFRNFKSQLEGALLFGHKALRSGSILHWPAPPASEPYLDLDIELLDPPAARGHRKQSLFTDHSWKKSGGVISALFKSFVPTENSTISTLQVTLGIDDDSNGTGFSNPECNWLAWSHVDKPTMPMASDAVHGHINSNQSTNTKLVTGKDHWKVLSVLGPSNTRSLALQEPYVSLRMTPVVSLAARILRRREETSSNHPLRPQTGFVFCGAGALSEEGLPFHIEGPFLQDFSVQGLSMPPSPAERRIAVTMPNPKISSSSTTSSSLNLPRNSILLWNSALITDIMEILLPKLLQEVRSELSKTTLDRSVLYVLWPYLPRMSPRLAHIVRTSKMLLNLSSMPIYLRGGELGLVKDCLLTTSPVPVEVRKYLQSSIPIGAVPSQITNDLLAYPSSSHFGLRVLTPSALRDILKRDAELHCRRLRGSLDQLVIPLLRFCLSDIPNVNESREIKRKYFRALGGCPLLPTSDGNIRCLPGQPRDRIVFCSAALQALLPHTLYRQLVYPLGLQFLYDMTMNYLEAKDTLFVGGIDSAFLEDHSTTIFPVYWRGMKQAISWRGFISVNTIGTYESKEEVDTSLSSTYQLSLNANNSQLFPSPLFIFILWKEMLSVPAVPLVPPIPDELSIEFDEKQKRDLKRLEEWPLLPVLSAGRKLLLDPTLLSYCIWEEEKGTSLQSSQGIQNEPQVSPSQILNDLSENIARDWLTSLKSNNSNVNTSVSDSLASNSQSSESIMWGWTSESRVDKMTSNQGDTSNSKSITSVHQAVVNSSITASTPVLTSSSTTATTTTTVSRRSHEEIILQEILLTLGFPVIDRDFFLRSPLIASKTVPVFRGLKLLKALLELYNDQGVGGEFNGGIPIVDYSNTAIEVSVAASTSRSYLLDFKALSIEDRTVLLLEIFRGSTESDRQTLMMVKHLPLFTSREGKVVTVDNNRGAVWCASEHIAEEVDLCRRFSKSEVLFPIILIHNPILVERVYSVIDISELNSISTIVQRFLLPALLHGNLLPEKTFLIMNRLKEKWTNYREVPELLNTLRKVAFIPIRSEEVIRRGRVPPRNEIIIENHQHVGDDDNLEDNNIGYYRPEEMISWKNEELFGILKSHPYFPPNNFRDESWHDMLLDLGMTLTLTKEKLITIVEVMETAFQTLIISTEDEATGAGVGAGIMGSQFSTLRQEATLLLTYFCGQSGIFAELLDFSLAKRLSTIRFIPVEVPVAVEPGGTLLTKWEIVRFCDVLARNSAALGYSVLPVLPLEMEPSQIYFSSLGITVNPPLEVILRHLRNLIEAAPLDRWSTPSYLGLPREPQLIFSAIFQQLQDLWNDISPSIRNSFSEIDLIPVGHHLVKATRLFFRLSEDLSPFMYELPRCFGPQEILLKKIGVSECPSINDYIQFLQELACETDNTSLNPNELNAVLTIIQLIVSELIENNDLHGNATDVTVNSLLFVPDEDAILRNVKFCVANDDDWLHDRSTSTLKHLGYYFLHPKLLSSTSSSSNVFKQSISSNDTTTNLVSLLKIPLLSAIVCEVLSSTDLKILDTHKEQIIPIKKALSTSSFALSLFGLFKKMKLPLPLPTIQNRLSAVSETNVIPYLVDVLGNIDIKLVEELQTQLIIRDDRIDRRGITGTHINDPRIYYPSLSYLKKMDATTSTSTATSDVIHHHHHSQDLDSELCKVKLIVYVNEGLLVPPVTLSLAVSRGICQSLNLPLYVTPTVSLLLDSFLTNYSDLSHFGSISMSTSIGVTTATATATICNCLNIGSNGMMAEEERGVTDDVDRRTATTNSNEMNQKLRRGLPGQMVIESDQALLELKPFRVFKRGEVVAVLINHNNNSIFSSATSNPPSNNGLLKYGIIVSSGIEEENSEKNMRELSVSSILPKLTINIGESSLIHVMSTDVYSFQSTRKIVKPSSQSSNNINTAFLKNEGAIMSSATGGKIRYQSSIITDKSIGKSNNNNNSSGAISTIGLSDTSSTSFSIINSTTSPIPIPTTTTTTTPTIPIPTVSISSLQSDVLEALHSLLQRCQIPQSLDTESMCSRILELNDKLAVTDNQLHLERTKLAEVTGILNQTLASWRCEICVTSDRSYVMVPCGHTLCHNCQEKLQQNRCPFCRANIHQKIRFFITEGTHNIR